ncbi:type II toxin-antitoxin system RelE/ParE family toxin [Halpernia sp.]|uniref:type II toxin-antitoxin system RelE/ParE family toxin n=1 Tax=Halpernia sp. TaxID=2782209 RepID=UPI003A95D2CB
MIAFELHWSFQSRKSLRDIRKYYSEVANIRISNKLVQDIISSAEILKDSQYIGQKEILLENRKSEYRYLVYINYKIIYSVDVSQKKILIHEVFDCRQNPLKLENISE